MTDEEMAEEYCNHLQSEMLAYTPENPRQQRTVSLLDVEEAFLAGLKAGRPQWHDLRKDSNDLPEKMGLGSKEVYVVYKDGVTDFACYRFDKKYWERSENEELVENIIAWCEIPTFDKE